MNGARLEVVDGLLLSAEYRALLRPGESVKDSAGRTHVLPRFFYRVESWRQAKETRLSAHFTLAELMSVDCREASLLLDRFPHYIPCAVVILCRYLEMLRQATGEPIYICVNGGYRSISHRFSSWTGPHCWGTAANIYRIGHTFLDGQKEIDGFGRLARSLAPEMRVKPFGHGKDETDDHLHLDIGYVNFVPFECDEAVGEKLI